MPFLDEPSPDSDFTSHTPFMRDDRTEVASDCLFLAAEKGNPREVYLKLLQALTSLSFTPHTGTDSPADDTEDNDDLEAELQTPSVITHSRAETRANAYRKLQIIIKLLAIVYSRIKTTFPSRFLSQTLPALLNTFTRAVEVLDKTEVENTISCLLAFMNSVQPPSTRKKRRMTGHPLGPDGRPTLPPRTITVDSIAGADISKLSIHADETEEAKEKRLEKEDREKTEEELQIRLLQSFLSYLIEVYILRCPSEDPLSQKENDAAQADRGINLHLSSRLLKSNKFVVGGVIAAEVSKSTAAPSSSVWQEMLDMAYQLNLTTTELQELCCAPASSEMELEDLEEPITPVGGLGPMPKFVEDIPLSKIGSLILLASRIFEKESITSQKIRIFPEHRNICHKYLTKGGGSGDIGVLDAVLFLGTWALSSGAGGFGDAPDHVEDGEEGWLMYLQVGFMLNLNSVQIDG